MIELGKTLIVDDSPTYLKLLTTLLRPYASSVLTAETARDAIAIIDATPDLDVVVSAPGWCACRSRAGWTSAAAESRSSKPTTRPTP